MYILMMMSLAIYYNQYLESIITTIISPHQYIFIMVKIRQLCNYKRQQYQHNSEAIIKMSMHMPIRTSLPLPPQQTPQLTIHNLKPRPASPKFGSAYGLPSPKMYTHTYAPACISGSAAGSNSSQCKDKDKDKDKSDLIDQIISNCNHKKSQSPRNIGKRVTNQQCMSKNGSLKTQPVQQRGKQNYPNFGSSPSFDKTPLNNKHRVVTQQVYRASLQPLQSHPFINRQRPGIFMKSPKLATQDIYYKTSPRIFKATSPTSTATTIGVNGSGEINMNLLSPSRLPKNRPNSKDKDNTGDNNNTYNYTGSVRADLISKNNSVSANNDNQQKQRQKQKQKQAQLMSKIQKQRNAHLQHCKRQQRKLRLYYVQLQNKLCEMRNKELRALAQYQSSTLKQYDTCMKILTNNNNNDNQDERVQQCKQKMEDIGRHPQLKVNQDIHAEIRACLGTNVSGIYFSFDQTQFVSNNNSNQGNSQGKIYTQYQ